jgi:hypothetical protein
MVLLLLIITLNEDICEFTQNVSQSNHVAIVGSLAQRVNGPKAQWSEGDEVKGNYRIWDHRRPQKIISIKITINEFLFIYVFS